MKKIFLALLAVLIFSSLVSAQARPIGMGGAFVGLANDTNAIFINPAGVSSIRTDMAAMSAKIQEDGSEYTTLGAVEATPYGNLGVGYISSTNFLGKITRPSATADQGDIPIKALDQVVIMSYAKDLNEGKVSLGSNMRLGSSHTVTANGLEYGGGGVDFDLAALLRPRDNLTCGIAYKSLLGKGLGSTVGFSAGVTSKINSALTVNIDNGKAGCEWQANPTIVGNPALALRLGRDGVYNTLGFGFAYKGFGVDYAYYGKEAPVHYVTVSLDMERERKYGYKQRIAQL